MYNERKFNSKVRCKMKYFSNLFFAFSVWLYRLTGGKIGGSMGGSRVLLLTTTGRKSGKVHTLPLGCFDHKEGYVIVASNGGLPTNPAWYHNLKSNPHVTVQVMDKVLSVTAEELSGEARTQAWQHVITTAPSYAGYEKKTTREIPLILLRPSQ
jgi:deazaflavin-dependent oxidoreductase (nitroreductase family)